MFTQKHPVLYTISGIVMIIAAIFAFFFPFFAANMLVYLLGIVFLVSGVFSIIACFVMKKRSHLHLGWFICEAILNIVLAVLLFTSPASLSAAVLGYVLIIFVLVSSVMQIFYAVSARAMGLRSWIWLLILGILGTIFSIIILFSGMIESQMFLGLFAGVYLLQEGLALLAAGLD